MRRINTIEQFSGLSRLIGPMCLIWLIWLISSCSSELEGPEDQKGVTLRVMSYENQYVEVDAVTRATVSWQPDGYKESHEYLAYGIFFTKQDGSVVKNKFHYGADKKWRMIEDVEPSDETHPYYLYGYMPFDAADVTIAPPSGGTYKDGAVMTFTGLNAAMLKDLCIITAAKDATREKAPEWTEESPKYNYELSNGLDWLPTGDFKCNIKSGDNANTLFFLYDHMYASLRLCFRIGEIYHQVRDIVIKRIELESYQDEACEHLMPKLKTTVTLRANTDHTTPIVGDIVFSADPSGEKMEKVLIYNNPDASWANRTENNETVNDRLPCLDGENNKVYVDKSGYIPQSGSTNYYKLTTTYDIYDLQGNLIRKNQSAVNVLNPKELFNQPQLLRGYQYTLRMTISPTYLYMMSDDDLEFKIDIEH
jgi:hypothetical protein